MKDLELMAPLAAFHGAKPAAPRWFSDALAVEPERQFIEVDGAKIDTLAWGPRGRPGLILLHGGAAHSHWWSFLAPFFAEAYRVVAPTFSGMGQSEWRAQYAFPQFAKEAVETGQKLGAFDAGPPVFVGHSFGSRVSVVAAHLYVGEIAGAVIVDPPFFAPDPQRSSNPPRIGKPHRDHASLGALVARFRLMPPQIVENLFILDHIARHSGREFVEEGKARWRLGFDHHFWEKLQRTEISPMLQAARTPLALARGARSKLFKPRDADYFLSLAAPGTPHIVLPEAEHHVMIDQPLAFVAMVNALLQSWPAARRRG